MNWKEITKTQDLHQLDQALNHLDINERDERDRTPLMLLLTNRWEKQAIAMLLDKKPDLEAEDKLGETALMKAVKFKQIEAIHLLLEAGVQLDSSEGITKTAWQLARRDYAIADMLLATPGSIRLTLSKEEQASVDEILYEENRERQCKAIASIQSPVLLHAIANGYNWDDGPEPMLVVAQHSSCLAVTLNDMFELLEGDYWIQQDKEQLSREDRSWYDLAELINKKLAAQS